MGAGFVGAEVASTARSLGVEVTLIELAPVPLARVLGEEVGGVLAERYRAHGVDLRMGVGLRGCAPAPDGGSSASSLRTARSSPASRP